MFRDAYKFFGRGKWNYILAFCIPMLIFIIFFTMKEIMPFGENTILLSDANTQNYPFLLELYRKLHSGESLFFSWDLGLGTNFYVIFLVFATSPFNWLLMLLPEPMLEMGICWMIPIKVSLCGVAAVYYFMHAKVFEGFRWQRQFSLMLGLGYVLSNAVLCYHFLFQWLDIYILLPILALALERLIENAHWKTYLILLLAAMLCNFVLAFQVCVFLAFWFLCQTDWNSFRKKFFLFAGTSLLAAILCMVVLLPAICMTRQREVVVHSFDLVSYLWDLANKMLPLNELEMIGAVSNTFNVYCGTVFAFGALFYLLFGKDSMGRRIKLTAFFVFIYISLCVPILGVFWQMAVPHGFYNRFAFIYVFVVLYIAAKGLRDSMEASIGRGIAWLIVSALIFAGILFFTPKVSDYEVYVTAMFVLAIMGICMILLQRNSIRPVYFVYILMSVTIVELAASAQFSLYRVQVVNWKEDMEYTAVSSLLEHAEKTNGRMGISGIYNVNRALLFGRKSAGFFSSMTQDAVCDLYQHLGLTTSTSLFAYENATEFTDLLLNVDTIISENPIPNEIEDKQHKGKWYLMQSDHTVGYGFMTDLDKYQEDFSVNALENQNALFQAMGGQGELFSEYSMEGLQIVPNMLYYERSGENTIHYINSLVQSNNKGVPKSYEEALKLEGEYILFNGIVTMTLDMSEDIDDFYLYFSSEYASYQVMLDDKNILEKPVEGGCCIVHVGAVQRGQTITITSQNKMLVNRQGTLYIYGASYHRDVFEKYYRQVSEEAMQVQSMNGRGMVSEVTAIEDGMLYTSIVDDGGFSVYVDGVKTEHKLLSDCLICVPLTAGTHIVEFKYCPPGFTVGLGISLAAFVVMLVIWNKRHIKYLISGR